MKTGRELDGFKLSLAHYSHGVMQSKGVQKSEVKLYKSVMSAAFKVTPQGEQNASWMPDSGDRNSQGSGR